MSRRRVAAKRLILPDHKYGDETIARFINMVMTRGKKSCAEKIVYGALNEIAAKKEPDALEVFKQAIDNVRPRVEVKSRRVGGATYQVPVEVHAHRRTTLAMRWLVEAAHKRGEKSMGLRLAAEALEAFENKGTAIKKKEETHRMAEANRAFAHYRW